MGVGMETTGYSRWFERLLAALGIELWIGDPAEIKSKRVKKQKTDRRHAQLLLRLMREDNFPRIWVPSQENRDLRQLLWHRYRLVQMRTRIMNQLQALAMNEGRRWKTKLWSEQGKQSWRTFRGHLGRVGDGKTCWTYWVDCIRRSRNSLQLPSRKPGSGPR